jgi:hypothetical protein
MFHAQLNLEEMPFDIWAKKMGWSDMEELLTCANKLSVNALGQHKSNKPMPRSGELHC